MLTAFCERPSYLTNSAAFLATWSVSREAVPDQRHGQHRLAGLRALFLAPQWLDQIAGANEYLTSAAIKARWVSRQARYSLPRSTLIMRLPLL